MPPDPKQLLSTVQALISSEMGWQLSFPCHEDGGELEPFVWNREEQGKLTPLNLVRAEGWLQIADGKGFDGAKVIDQWQAPERTGSVNGERWLVPDWDAAGILLDEVTQAERVQLYQNLLELLQTQLHNLQMVQLSCGTDYTLTLLAAEAENQWICLAPTVPHATTVDENSPIQVAMGSVPQSSPDAASLIGPQAEAILDRLGTIQLYGYYGGGYNQVHDYRYTVAQGATLDQAIEQAMLLTGLLEIGEFEAFRPTNSETSETSETDEATFEHLAQFLQTLTERRVYRFSFWNREHWYILGQEAASQEAASQETANEWVGVVLRSRFTYNP